MHIFRGFIESTAIAESLKAFIYQIEQCLDELASLLGVASIFDDGRIDLIVLAHHSAVVGFETA